MKIDLNYNINVFLFSGKTGAQGRRVHRGACCGRTKRDTRVARARGRGHHGPHAAHSGQGAQPAPLPRHAPDPQRGGRGAAQREDLQEGELYETRAMCVMDKEHREKLFTARTSL